jgi:hypothetical protein
MMQAAKKRKVELRSLSAAAIHDTRNICRDDNCPIDYLHASHGRVVRRGPKTKMRSL